MNEVYNYKHVFFQFESDNFEVDFKTDKLKKKLYKVYYFRYFI